MFGPDNKSVKRVGIILCTMFLLAFFIGFQGVSATTIGDTGLDTTKTTAFGGEAPIEGNLPTAIGKAVGGFLAFIGVIFFILMIYGGFLWMTARGNEQQVSKAKDLIISAIAGLIIVFAAYAITVIIGNALTSGSSAPAP